MSGSIALRPEGVLEAALYVDDLDEALTFYRDILHLTVIGHEPPRHLFFRCGSTVLLLFNPDETSTGTVHIGTGIIPRHGRHGPGHVAFAVSLEEMARWKEHFRKANIPIESEIEWPQGGHSIYVRDPSGNSIELATRTLWPQLNASDLDGVER